jgi:hypothetical protein
LKLPVDTSTTCVRFLQAKFGEFGYYIYSTDLSTQAQQSKGRLQNIIQTKRTLMAEYLAQWTEKINATQVCK